MLKRWLICLAKQFIIYFGSIMNLQMDLKLQYDPYASACMPPLSYDTTILISIIASVLGILWTGYNLLMLRRIDLAEAHEEQTEEGLIQDMPIEQRTLLLEFGYKLYDACLQFSKYQYLGCLGVAVAAFLLLWFVSDLGPSAAIAFLVGVFVNMLTGGVAFALSTRSSCRVAYCSRYGLAPTFRTNYQAASVIAFSTTSLNLLVLTVAVQLYKQEFQLSNSGAEPKYFVKLFQAVAGYGLGASFTALFARLGGGIFQAATEAGSELIGKAQGALAFNNSRNAATVSKHAGLNVGGMVGAQSDQLGSYCELTCVAFLLSSSSLVGYQGQKTVCAVSLSALSLPLVILSMGMIVSVVTSVVGVLVSWVQTQVELAKAMRVQRLIPAILMSGVLYLCVFLSLPSSFQLAGVTSTYAELHAPWEGYLCGFIGLLASLALFLCAEVTNSKNLPFVGMLADKCRAGPAASITLGLAFGYFSSFIPTLFFCLSAYFSYNLLGFYGVSLCALAMLSTTPIYSALQTTYALASNALTAAKIANLNDEEKEILQQLAESGENAMAVNRATSMGCTALVGMTLFGGFLSNAHLDTPQAESVISLTDPLIFTGLLIGGIFPFVLAGLTVKAARKAVSPFKQEVERQLKEDEGIARGDSEADYAGSVKPLALKTLTSLLGPVILVLVAPFVFGLAIGPKIVTGILLGMIVSGLEFSSSASNSADAWRCAKKLIESGGVADEQGRVQGVDSEAYRGAAMGAEVGWGFGKCAGGSMGASIKVMGMLAVLFGGEFAALHS